jgi:nucleotide-binding universal stress UspA family protein
MAAISPGTAGRFGNARRLIVVGVDGSSNSVAALRRAGADAATDGAKVRAVCVHGGHIPLDDPRPTRASPLLDRPTVSAPPIVDQVATSAREILERSAVQALGPESDIELELVVRSGAPQDLLISEARAADLLVIGARSHNGPFSALLGSTAQFCAAHASCPVLVVPSSEYVPVAVGSD